MTARAWRVVGVTSLVVFGYLLLFGWVWAWQNGVWVFVVMTCLIAAYVILVFRVLVRR